MAAANAYRFKSVTWSGPGSATAIPGVVDCKEDDTTEGVTKHRTDNATTTQGIFVDGIGAKITISTTDLSLRGASGYTLGKTGAIVIVRELRANGVGAQAGDKTHTYASATLVDMTEGIPINGRGTLELTFEAFDTTGAAVCAFS
jgi:hypothetical protein